MTKVVNKKKKLTVIKFVSHQQIIPTHKIDIIQPCTSRLFAIYDKKTSFVTKRNCFSRLTEKKNLLKLSTALKDLQVKATPLILKKLVFVMALLNTINAIKCNMV